jgi:glucose dehydrogenase
MGRARKGGLSRRRLLRAGLALAAAPLARATRVRALSTPPALEADVCIIGSGPAGALLACALARRGINAMVVESGPARESARDPRFPQLEVYESVGPLNYPLAATRFRGAGGISNLWSGVCPRLQPIDFEPNPYTPPGAPWPIRYDDLEPYYLQAERELQITGVDRAPGAPPRRAPFPRPQEPSFPNVERLLQRTGAELALSRPPHSDRDGGPVRMADTHLPELAASPCATLISDATATRVVCAPNGRVEGIRLESFTAPPRLARARAYVIACGAIESARLMLLSGLGRRSDQVGRNFMEHPLAVRGVASLDTDFDLDPSSEWVSTDEFLAGAKHLGLGGVRISVVADVLNTGNPAPSRRVALQVRGEIECEPSPANRITLGHRRDAFGNPGARLTLDFTERDRRTIAYCETLVWQILAKLGVEDGSVATGALSWEHHHMGTCRMGDDPRTSVVDRHLRVHGTDSLYVASSAAFVTSGVSNPTLTIAALSLRLAEHLQSKLRDR